MISVKKRWQLLITFEEQHGMYNKVENIWRENENISCEGVIKFPDRVICHNSRNFALDWHQCVSDISRTERLYLEYTLFALFKTIPIRHIIL